MIVWLRVRVCPGGHVQCTRFVFGNQARTEIDFVTHLGAKTETRRFELNRHRLADGAVSEQLR